MWVMLVCHYSALYRVPSLYLKHAYSEIDIHGAEEPAHNTHERARGVLPGLQLVSGEGFLDVRLAEAERRDEGGYHCPESCV